jgi:hypothetical protein
MSQHTPVHVRLSVCSCAHMKHMFANWGCPLLGHIYVHRSRVSSPVHMGYPSPWASNKGVLVWVHVEHVFVEEGVLSGSYVYVHRRRVSSRVHMGNKGLVHSICVFMYITWYIYTHTLYPRVDTGGGHIISIRVHVGRIGVDIWMQNKYIYKINIYMDRGGVVVR